MDTNERKAKRKQAIKRLRKTEADMLEKISVFITGAFSLVAALAWNSVIQGIFDSNPALKENGPIAYALIVTFIAVAVMLWLSYVVTKLRARAEES